MMLQLSCLISYWWIFKDDISTLLKPWHIPGDSPNTSLQVRAQSTRWKEKYYFDEMCKI